MQMRSSLVVRASGCQCTSCNGPRFDPGICRHSGRQMKQCLIQYEKNNKNPLNLLDVCMCRCVTCPACWPPSWPALAWAPGSSWLRSSDRGTEPRRTWRRYGACALFTSSVSEPVFILYGSGSRILGWIPILIQSFDDQNLRKKFTDQKLQYTHP